MANIAIFRINYKSDFILTLNSDAGWMTPFCIKFWTGAPSQAYFAGYDGTTYTHCAPVAGDPTKLEVQFDDHHLPIGDLKFQIGYHFTVADFPTTVEDEVINQAAVIIDQDGTPMQVMLDLNGETAPEIQFSLPAYANEAQRIANEQERIANEEQRIANEQTRIQNEETRINQEQTRINQEEARVREFATLKQESETATTAANNAAALANQKAQLAADKAQLAADKATLAQDAANLANQKAQLAADKAELADTAAQLANDKAALAQQKAEYAQTQGAYAKQQGDYAKEQGDYAKQQGDYAKEQGDYAKQKGDDAAAQMQQQAQAFNEAQAARQTAYQQAEGTESGSMAGDGSRWGVFKTNEAARDALVDAKVADITNLQEAVAEGAVYDISANNSGATYADLTAALGTNGANIPQSLRRGGMSVKFVHSVDNKYVQRRYMLSSTTDADFANVANWQGVDEEPETGSHNLVESGGVKDLFDSQYGETTADFALSDPDGYKIVQFGGGHIKTKNFDSSKTATEEESGLMSNEDKSKLNTIEEGAEVNDVITTDNSEKVDLSLSDEDGYDIVHFKDGHVKTKYFNSKDISERVDALENGSRLILCIGDSITAGPASNTDYKGVNNGETYEHMMEVKNPSYEFRNQGVGGEDSLTILGRMSIVPYCIKTDVIIPATTTEVVIEIESSWTDAQGNRQPATLSKTSSWIKNFNPVYINGIKGNIDIVSETHQDDVTGDDVTESVYKFTREVAGFESRAVAGTPIVMHNANWKPDAFVIFMGTNDGSSFNVDDYIEQVKIAASHYNTEHFIVFSPYEMANVNLSRRIEEEKKLQKVFGNRYINLRQYLSTQGLYDAIDRGYVENYTDDEQVYHSYPTASDLSFMASGKIPPTLMMHGDMEASADQIHLGHNGYQVLADMLDARMKLLGYIK